MREIDVDEISAKARGLCLDANQVMGDDVRQALEVAGTREVSPLGREVLGQILENMAIAAAGRVPMCQDLSVVSGGQSPIRLLRVRYRPGPHCSGAHILGRTGWPGPRYRPRHRLRRRDAPRGVEIRGAHLLADGCRGRSACIA